jgi:hypothetical protein
MVAALTISLVGSACNSQQSAPATQSPQKEQGPAWELNYQATCMGTGAATDPSSCAGAYGFTVNADGTYQVGPGPRGEVIKGKLDHDDFTSLTTLTSSLVGGNSVLSTESCNGGFSRAEDYTLTLVKHGKKKEVLNKKGANLCSLHLEAQPAEDLHNEIIDLTEKYYTLPFPDACLEAAANVEALYPLVQKCSVNSDCGYLDLNFQPIPAQGESTVYADNCSVVKSLPAANVASIRNQLGALQSALDQAQTICGARIVREDCPGIQTFSSSAAPAVCEHNQCRPNPSL